MNKPTNQQRLEMIRNDIQKNNQLRLLTNQQLIEAHGEDDDQKFTELLKQMIQEMRNELASQEQPATTVSKREESKINSKINEEITDISKDKKPFSKRPDLKFEVNIYISHKSQKLLPIPDLEKPFFNFLIHCKTYINESRLSLILRKNKLSLAVLDINKKSSNQSQEHNLELDPLPPYEIIPSYVWIEFKYGDSSENAENELDTWLQCIDPKNITVKTIISMSDPFPKSESKTSDELALARLLKILHSFAQMPYSHFKPEDIEEFGRKIKKICSGFDYYADKIQEEFSSTLPSSTFELPKGILFYGPPRTGKTHSSKKVIELLNLWRIHADMAAGDFNKPLVGQSEQMINKIVDRCDVLSWELCSLFIDEIDGLCPNRKGSGASSGKVDLISVFLSVMDGNKRKKNLMVIGTSNRLKYMDDAFLQRLDIKLFIGLPDVASKEDWIKRIVATAYKAEEVQHARSDQSTRMKAMAYIKKVADFITVDFKDDLLRYTLNFTADAMKKSLSQIMTTAIQKRAILDIKTLKEDLKQLIYKTLNRICENDKIYVSNFTPPELVKESETLDNAKKYKNVNWNLLKKSSKQTGLAKFEQIPFEEAQIYTMKSLQMETADKIETLLAGGPLNALIVFEEFKINFSDYYSGMDSEYRKSFENDKEGLKSFFKDFKSGVWPGMLMEMPSKKLSSKPLYTQRMLIDLKEPAEERFQLEIKKVDNIGMPQVELVQKIKNSLAYEKEDNLRRAWEDFKKDFKEYYDGMESHYKSEVEKNAKILREFFEIFVMKVWPRILNDDKNNSIETFGISHEEFLISKDETLKILIRMAVEARINIILVFDIAYFTKAGITNDEGMAQEIIIATEEAMQYDSCLVVFDLDSLADITKEFNSLQSEIKTASQIAYSNDKNDPQFAYSISRKQAFRAALECMNMIPKTEKNHWFVTISNNNKLTLDFKEKVSWPATKQQRKIENEIILNNTPKTCQHCFETYREKDNDPNACGRHSSSYLYDEVFVNGLREINKDKKNYDPFKDTSVLPSLIYAKREQVFREMHELSGSKPQHHNIGRYKWECCQKSFWEKGEIKCQHVAFHQK